MNPMIANKITVIGMKIPSKIATVGTGL